ncbi:lachesin [Orussus abietinus]|uniref:lachesin n=1 Tax=Orussus abietinus TaxID=222816 RepID=UPI000624F85D|nr:lachesin [Orussus abietinus]
MTNRQRRSRYLTISILHIITIMCQALPEGPAFTEPIPNITVALGKDVNLPCVIENLGNYKVVWMHMTLNALLSVHTRMVIKIPRYSVTHNQNTWLLKINNVQKEDRGYYMCQINTNPMMSQLGYVEVVVPPNIIDSLSTQSNVVVREYQNVTLTCKADGYPVPILTWKRENGEAIFVDRRENATKFDGSQLNLIKIGRSQMGAYFCMASNGIPPSVSKRIVVEVEFNPMIWVPNQLVGAPAGTNVTIECQTEAYPPAVSYWIFNDTMVGNDTNTNDRYSTNKMENSYRTRMRLTIRNIQSSDFGNYRCISRNSLGETEGSIRLYEMAKPSISPKATETKSNTNKKGRKSTTVPPKRLTTIWPAVYTPYYPKRTEQPPLGAENIENPELTLREQTGAGSAYIVRWNAPQFMVVAMQYILTGPYMPPYMPQNTL